jgi:hypothetical protein
LSGALAAGVGLAALGATRSIGPAFAAFLLVGIGNGLVVVHERLIFHALVPDALMGRAFALLEALSGWAFVVAYLAGAALVAGVGVRACLFVAGGGVLLVWVASALALRRQHSIARAAGEASQAETSS